ncbi:hypothetical protein MTO96_042453 [Rhipicephalus appendiculatus]
MYYLQSEDQPSEDEEGRLTEGEGQPEEEGPADGASEEGPPDREEGQPELPVELSESFSKEEGEGGAATDELLDSYKKRVQLLEKQLDEERQRNARLCDALLDKIEIARSVCTCTKPRQGEHVVAQHVVAQLLVPQVSSEDDSTLLRAITPPPSQSPPDVVDRANVIQKVIEDCPSDIEVAKRVALGRKSLRNIFAEMGRLGLRKRMPA